MLNCQRERGERGLVKKIIILCILMLAIMGFGYASASTNQVTDFSWGVNKENTLRMVFDCNQLTGAKAELTSSLLKVTVNGKLNSDIRRRYSTNSSKINSISLSSQGDKTILFLPLKQSLKSSDYKLFVLKKNPGAKRPDRVVLDIFNGGNGATEQSKVENTPACINPTYLVTGGIQGKHITLDPGHGGSDPGTHGTVTGIKEKEITLPVSLKLKAMLEKKGAIVSMTRTTDVDVWGADATDAQELQARVDIAEKNKADLFISVHCNASVNPVSGGFSTYYNSKTPYDEQVAESIQNKLLKTASLDDLGVRFANFYVNKRCSMPGALVELLFLTNAREEKLLRSNWFQNKMAQAIADGIEDFYDKNGGGS